MSLLTLTLVLFLIMDPVGHIKTFIATLEGIDPKRQKYIIFREMLIALGVTLFFNFLGEYIFEVLAISDVTVYLASGVILFLVAIKIIFSRPDSEEAPLPPGEPVIFPLAVPMIAGPALLATVMLYAQSETKVWPLLGAIFISWLASAIILVNAKTILKLLGTGGLTACEKLMGMVLVLLAVQRFASGVLLLKASS